MARKKKDEEAVELEELTQEGLLDFVSVIEKDDEDIAAIKADRNERVSDFCSRFGITKKQFNDALKQYKLWKKDRNEFNTATCIVDKLVDLMTGEKCVQFVSEKDIND